MNQNTKNMIIKLKSFCFWSWREPSDQRKVFAQVTWLPVFRSSIAKSITIAFLEWFCKFTYNQILVYLFIWKEYKQKIETQLRNAENREGTISQSICKIQTRKQTLPVEIYETFLIK